MGGVLINCSFFMAETPPNINKGESGGDFKVGRSQLGQARQSNERHKIEPRRHLHSSTPLSPDVGTAVDGSG